MVASSSGRSPSKRSKRDTTQSYRLRLNERDRQAPHRSNLRQREFAPICREGLIIYGLRHSPTSLARAAGVAVVAVAGMLGHESARLVQERYGHALPPAHREASLAVERMLRPPRKSR